LNISKARLNKTVLNLSKTVLVKIMLFPLWQLYTSLIFNMWI